MTHHISMHISLHANISTRQNRISSTYSQSLAIRHFDPPLTAAKPRISSKSKKPVSMTSKNSFFKRKPNNQINRPCQYTSKHTSKDGVMYFRGVYWRHLDLIHVGCWIYEYVVLCLCHLSSSITDIFRVLH